MVHFWAKTCRTTLCILLHYNELFRYAKICNIKRHFEPIFILLFCKHLFSTYFPYYVRNKLFFSKNVPKTYQRYQSREHGYHHQKKNIYAFQDITSSQLANHRKSSAEIQSWLKYIMDAVYQQSRRISFRFLILSISIISLPHTLSALLSLKCLHISNLSHESQRFRNFWDQIKVSTI